MKIEQDRLKKLAALADEIQQLLHDDDCVVVWKNEARMAHKATVVTSFEPGRVLFFEKPEFRKKG